MTPCGRLGRTIFLSLVLVSIPAFEASSYDEITPEEAKVFRVLKKKPQDPYGWHLLASLAVDRGFYTTAIEASKTARERWQRLSSKDRKKQKVSFSEIDLLGKRALYLEAKSMAEEEHGLSVNFYQRGSGRTFTVDELRQSTKSRPVIRKPRKIRLAAFTSVPDRDSREYRAYLSKRLELCQSWSGPDGCPILPQLISRYDRDLQAFEDAKSVASEDLAPLLEIAKVWKNRFADPAGEEYAKQAVRRSLKMASEQQGARWALFQLLVARSRLPGHSKFDRIAEEFGITYLDDLEFVTRDVVLTHEALLRSSDYGFLGSVGTYGTFVSVAKEGEIVLRDYNRVRGLASHLRLTQRPTIDRERDAYVDREIWGDIAGFLRENQLDRDDVFSKEPPANLPSRYSPCELVRTEKSAVGGLLGGISNFIEDHPVASALIAGTAVYLLSRERPEPTRRRESPSLPGSSVGRDLYISDWSSWRDLKSGRLREATVGCSEDLYIEVEEWYSKKEGHFFRRDVGAELLPKKHATLEEFISVECSAGTGVFDHDRRMAN